MVAQGSLKQTALVIVPTYNEAENIERLVQEILAQPAPLHVVIVDDNSPDGTGEIADALAAEHERVQVIHRPAKLGLGTAYIAGFKLALEKGYGYAITMDADFSHNPRYLPGLLALMKDYDVAIGSRYVPGGGSTGCSWARIFLSRGANAFARFMLGLKTHDCTAGFRCYKAEVLRAIELDTIFSSGYSFLVEMVTRCERRGYAIGELPIIFDNRRLGRSKISRVEIIKSVYTILRLRFSWLPWERLLAFYRRRIKGAPGHSSDVA
ncbi:MAG: polyprenol monophosphomannose synthase [Anaerolineae bacterium]|nr:polyprenol monophosphomannose synthase [Anaerolineae bacterium]